MALYISGERLRQAVARLRESRAATGMINFLILKRALALNPPDGFVRFSKNDQCLQTAINELTHWPNDDEEEGHPFVNVFGTINAKNDGTMSQKYTSNGPGDTLRNRTWDSVVETKQAEKSLAAKLTENYRNDLERLTLKRDKNRQMPRVDDTAVWYFRGRDIAPMIGANRDAVAIEQILVKQFCTALDLTSEDLRILFAPETVSNG